MGRRWRLTALTAVVAAVMYVPLVYVARLAACDPAPPIRCDEAGVFDRVVVLVMVVFAGAVPAIVALSAPKPEQPTARAVVVVLLLAVWIPVTFLLAGVDYRGCKRDVDAPVAGCER